MGIKENTTNHPKVSRKKAEEGKRSRVCMHAYMYVYTCIHKPMFEVFVLPYLWCFVFAMLHAEL